MTISVELTGEWGSVQKMFQRLPETLKLATEAQAKASALLYLQQLKDAISNQTLSLVPLSEDYFNRKMSEGLDSRTLIATGEYLNKLRMKEVTGSNNEVLFFVGAFEEDQHEASGLSMAQLATYLEHGTSRMPARPHFEPVFKRMKDSIIKQITDAIKNKMLELFR
jgi:HK97 gp10 family phage protein